MSGRDPPDDGAGALQRGDRDERLATEVSRGLRPARVLPHQPDSHLLHLAEGRRSTSWGSTTGSATSTTSTTSTPSKAAIPNVFVPADREAPQFSSIEDICNYLLRHREVTGWMKTLGPAAGRCSGRLDEQTESLAASAGLRWLAPARRARRAASTPRSSLPGWATMPGCRERPERARPGRPATEAGGSRGAVPGGSRPGRADAVRRLGEDHLLRPQRGGLGGLRGEGATGEPGPQGDAPDRPPRHCRRSGPDPVWHTRRAVDERHHRPSRAHAVPRRLGRQRLPGDAHERTKTAGEGVHPPAGRPARRRGLRRLLRGGLPRRTPARASCTWASSTHGSAASAR